MNWLLFYLLAALHPVAFVVIAWKCNMWKLRFILWALLSLPAIWFCWDYYAIKNEHAQMCAAEGGLKVLIQPEKVDRVRFVGDSYGKSRAESTFQVYFPQAKVVEVSTEERGSNGYRLQRYDSYTASANPSVGKPMTKFPWVELRYIIAITPAESLDTSVFEISKREFHTPYRSTITETLLSKQGKVYAKHTEIVHWWAGIRYPDAVPTWRCPDTNQKFPPKGEPHAPYEKWEYPPFADTTLLDLILK